MGTRFFLRVINLSKITSPNNAVIDDMAFDGNALKCYLNDYYPYLSMTGPDGTVGDVGAPTNVDHGEPWDTNGSLRWHNKLRDFLIEQFANPDFDDMEWSTRDQLRSLYRLTDRAINIQRALIFCEAPVVITVSWG